MKACRPQGRQIRPAHKAEKMFTVMVKFVAPVLLVVILVAYVAAQFGLFSM